MSNGTLTIDNHGERIQVFAPRLGVSLTSPYTPTIDEVVMVAADVTITIDSVGAAYEAGSVIGLAKGITYSLSATTAAHKM